MIPPLQVAIMFISLLLYGFGPIGVDLYKRSSMVSRQQDELDDQNGNVGSTQVLVTSLSLENIGYLEPANFWIGPAAVCRSSSPL